ncbi:hypothetical protein [Paenibacillus typhae]|uniref:Uncharacterized protein n=1 Tax=Paenibacillus typhae TaxID=1174501 RepID=A0A1G8PTK9_9BACL|nr:hypothetical protein [Paenibacillus typhae]SDI95762.1 hypothetical protein SAMN05216192_11056 [Paenibacillus typhae]
MNNPIQYFVTKEAIATLTEKLNLPILDERSQDWELEISDHTRVAEFITCYEIGALNKAEKLALMKLILSSFDEALNMTGVMPELWRRIKGHLINDFDMFRETIRYWALAEEDYCDGFELTPYMRELVAQYNL